MTSGKTTLAEALRARFDRSALLRFAGPLKDGLALMGIEKGHLLYRPAAQYIGTDLVRKFDPDWWVQQMSKRVSSLPDVELIVIDDVRFPNEANWCWLEGFIMVRLLVSPEMMVTRGSDPSTFNHPSETALDDWAGWDMISEETDTVEQRVQEVLGWHRYYQEICGAA